MPILYNNKVKISIVHSDILANNIGQPLENKGQVIRAEGKYRAQEIEWCQEDLDQYTAGSYLVSPNLYRDGKRDGEHWESCQVLFFDFDNKDATVPIDEHQLIRRVQSLPGATSSQSCYIHHSRNSLQGGNGPRLHLLIPLRHPLTDPEQYSLLYDHLKEKYFPESDKAGDLGRMMIPGRLDPPSTFVDGDFLWEELTLDGAYAEQMDLQRQQIQESLEAVQKANSNPISKGRAVYLSVDTLVQLSPGRYMPLAELDPLQKPQFLCPYCGHRPGRGNPGKANATYQLNDKGIPIVFCSSCRAEKHGGSALKGVYNIERHQQFDVVRDHLRDKYKDYFFLEDTLLKVYIETDAQPFSIAPGKAHMAAIDEPVQIKSRLISEMARAAKPRRFFRFNQEGDMNIEAPYYEWRGSKLIGRNSALPEDQVDNSFIEVWLDSLFGMYKYFIKKWLALYCYTNYKPLPVLVLYSKERGTGKNVFAEAVCSIFEPLHSRDVDYKNFTEAFQGKLWYIDEQNTDSKQLYEVIKQIGGNNVLEVNNKYGLKHQVDRNLSVILTTNNLTPMQMEADELQPDESNNQFFVLEMKPIDPKDRRSDIALDIRKRLGHYIRTELKQVYEQLQQDPDLTRYRYGLPVPITPYEERLYSLSRTSLEHEAEEVWDAICDGRYVDVIGQRSSQLDFKTCTMKQSITINTSDGEKYIMPAELRKVVKGMGCETSPNRVRDYLQQKGRLGLENKRIRDRRLGYSVTL